jgi:hypothetical protein
VSAASFDGLLASSFDAYRLEKWSSNVFTRERLDVKQQLLALARALEPTFEKLGLRVQRYASDEYPSLRNGKCVDAQWVFFWRTEEERLVLEREVDLEKTLAATLADPTPMTRHAFLCLRLDHDGLELSFRLHRDAWVDRLNLANKLEEAEWRSELVALLHQLPQGVDLTLGDEANLDPRGTTAEQLAEIVARHGELDPKEGFLRLGVTLQRDEVNSVGAGLPDALEPQLGALAEVYRFVAWSEGNNAIRSDERFLEEQAQREARRQELESRAAARQAQHEEKKKEGQAARRELEELFRREAAARAAAPPRKGRATPKAEPANEEPTATAARRKPAQENRPRPTPRNKAEPKRAPAERKPRPQKSAPTEVFPVAAGQYARVTKGPFAGQVGLVQEIDGRGNVRLMLGLLATRLPEADVLGLGPNHRP